MTASVADIIDRVSYISSATKAKGDDAYAGIKTPSDAIEGGALRAGGRPDLYTREYCGLLMQYAAVGVVYGTLPSTVYPVLQVYLNMDGTQITSASVLLTLPWSFKVIYGILSDCFPIFGYRRRPFMMIGWTLCALMLLIMACEKMGKPYYIDRSLADREPSSWTEDEIAAGINLDAPGSGSKLVVMMMLAAVGYVGADVAADAIVVELAQREPENVRGTTQTTIYLVRTIFITFAYILTGFLFNGEQYGGDFDFSLTFPQLMIILLVFVIPTIPLTWIFIKEDKHPGVNVKDYIVEFWELLQSRAMYQVIFYVFFSGIFEGISVTCGSPIQEYWVHATPLNSTIASVIGNAIFALVLYYTGKRGLHWNWRWIHAITLIASYAIDATVSMLVIWDVVRNQWFYLGPPLLENLPAGVSFIVGTYVFVELAGEGNEGAVYGLLTTVSNLSSTFSSTITKNIDAQLKVSSVDIQEDTHEVRANVTYAYLFAYLTSILGLCMLPLLPPQKKETQELKAKGGKSKIIGILTVVYLTFSLIWSVMVNIMSIYPSTSCLKIAGGDGC